MNIDELLNDEESSTREQVPSLFSEGAVLVDMGNLLYRMFYTEWATEGEFNEEFARHLVLNSLLSIRKKFESGTYKHIIMAFDMSSWRREVFPPYKWRRRNKDADKQTEEQKEMGEMVMDFVSTISNELVDHLPFLSVKIGGAEADDVIAVLAKEFSRAGSHVVVISSDSDFPQLMHHKGVRLWDPFKTTFVKLEGKPIDYLMEKVIRGDSKDDVPNAISDDDVFMDPNKKQNAVSAKRYGLISKAVKHVHSGDLDVSSFNTEMNLVVEDMGIWKKDKNGKAIKGDLAVDAETLHRNILRNFTLLDLITPATPHDVQSDIKSSLIHSYNTRSHRSSNLYKYFMAKGLDRVAQEIGKFI